MPSRFPSWEGQRQGSLWLPPTPSACTLLLPRGCITGRAPRAAPWLRAEGGRILIALCSSESAVNFVTILWSRNVPISLMGKLRHRRGQGLYPQPSSEGMLEPEHPSFGTPPSGSSHPVCVRGSRDGEVSSLGLVPRDKAFRQPLSAFLTMWPVAGHAGTAPPPPHTHRAFCGWESGRSQSRQGLTAHLPRFLHSRIHLPEKSRLWTLPWPASGQLCTS